MKVTPLNVIKSLLAVTISIHSTSGAQALPECDYKIYSPAMLNEGIRFRLAEFNLATPLVTEYSSQNWRQHDILRAPNATVGRVLFEKNLITKESSVTFRTSDEVVLLKASERVFACPEHRPNRTCYETTITSAFGGDNHTDNAPFQIRDGIGGLQFLRYGEPVMPISWRMDFEALLEWLTQYYIESVEVSHLDLPEPMAAVQFAINADPLLLPYRDHIHINVDRSGRYVLTGRLSSNAQHSALLSKFFDIGVYNIQSWIVIDTGFRLPHQDLFLRLQSCY